MMIKPVNENMIKQWGYAPKVEAYKMSRPGIPLERRAHDLLNFAAVEAAGQKKKPWNVRYCGVLFEDDMKIKVINGRDEVIIPANKHLLCYSSALFRGLIESHCTAKNHRHSYQNKLVLPIENFNPIAIRDLVHYCKHEKVENLKEKAADLIFVAELFMINDLVELCRKTLIDNTNVSNVVEHMGVALAYDYEDLRDKCFHIMTQGEDLFEMQSVLVDSWSFKMRMKYIQLFLDKEAIENSNELCEADWKEPPTPRETTVAQKITKAEEHFKIEKVVIAEQTAKEEKVVQAELKTTTEAKAVVEESAEIEEKADDIKVVECVKALEADQAEEIIGPTKLDTCLMNDAKPSHGDFANVAVEGSQAVNQTQDSAWDDPAEIVWNDNGSKFSAAEQTHGNTQGNRGQSNNWNDNGYEQAQSMAQWRTPKTEFSQSDAWNNPSNAQQNTATNSEFLPVEVINWNSSGAPEENHDSNGFSYDRAPTRMQEQRYQRDNSKPSDRRYGREPPRFQDHRYEREPPRTQDRRYERGPSNRAQEQQPRNERDIARSNRGKPRWGVSAYRSNLNESNSITRGFEKSESSGDNTPYLPKEVMNVFKESSSFADLNSLISKDGEIGEKGDVKEVENAPPPVDTKSVEP